MCFKDVRTSLRLRHRRWNRCSRSCYILLLFAAASWWALRKKSGGTSSVTSYIHLLRTSDIIMRRHRSTISGYTLSCLCDPCTSPWTHHRATNTESESASVSFLPLSLYSLPLSLCHCVEVCKLRLIHLIKTLWEMTAHTNTHTHAKMRLAASVYEWWLHYVCGEPPLWHLWC